MASIPLNLTNSNKLNSNLFYINENDLKLSLQGLESWCSFLILCLSGEPVNCPKLFNGNYAHPTDCSKFITCSNGRSIERDCGASLVYDYKNDRCEFPAQVNCRSIGTTPNPQQQTTAAQAITPTPPPQPFTTTAGGDTSITTTPAPRPTAAIVGRFLPMTIVIPGFGCSKVS